MPETEKSPLIQTGNVTPINYDTEPEIISDSEVFKDENAQGAPLDDRLE